MGRPPNESPPQALNQGGLGVVDEGDPNSITPCPRNSDPDPGPNHFALGDWRMISFATVEGGVAREIRAWLDGHDLGHDDQ